MRTCMSSGFFAGKIQYMDSLLSSYISPKAKGVYHKISWDFKHYTNTPSDLKLFSQNPFPLIFRPKINDFIYKIYLNDKVSL